MQTSRYLRTLAASTESTEVSKRCIERAKILEHRDFAKDLARELLHQARDLAASRTRLIASAERIHGDNGALVSGCHRDHYPDTVKNALRDMARRHGALVEESLRLWTKEARARRTTWMRVKDAIGVFHY